MTHYRSQPTRTFAEVERLWQSCDEAARALQRDTERRDALGADVAAFEARRRLTDFEDELAAALEDVRSMMASADHDHRASLTPKLAALLARIDAQADRIRLARCPPIAVPAPAPLPEDRSEASLQSAFDRLVALDQELDAARQQLDRSMRELEARRRRQRQRVQAAGYFEPEAESKYRQILAALDPPEPPAVLSVRKQWRAMSSHDRAKLKGQMIAAAIALMLAGAFYLWLALR